MFTMRRILTLAVATLTIVSLVLLGGTTARAETAWYSSGVTGENGTLGDQFFRVEWTVAAASLGQTRMTGYVYNDYGQPAKDVQLKIAIVDPNGAVGTSVIRPVRGLVPAGSRAYFDARVPASAAPYQVTVASFDFLEFPTGR